MQALSLQQAGELRSTPPITTQPAIAAGAFDAGAKSTHATCAPADLTAALTTAPRAPNAPVTTIFFPDRFTSHSMKS